MGLMGMPRFLRLLLLLTMIAALGACGWGSRQAATEVLPVDEMFASAHESLQRGNYERAIRYYQRLIARFPFGLYTEQAQLELAYAQFRASKPDEAISTVDRFLKTYPTHAKADYAQFLRGVINFQREASFLGRFVSIDASKRDQGAQRQSFIDFSKLVRDFPDSVHTDEARQRMVYLRNGMARHDVQIGQYYLRRGAYVAAVNRSIHVVENFQQAPEAGDALAIMVEAYQRMGEQTLADDTRRVLELNHPEHPYLRGQRIDSGKPFWRKMVPFG
jgi:outer membrane protein assembly factor BamD